MSVAEQAVDEARDWCGTPYRHQASLKNIGADCLGLLRGLYRFLYGHEAEYPPAYAAFGAVGENELLLAAAHHYLHPIKIPPHSRPAAGHVLLFRLRRNLPVRHVGIATGAEHMVHALSGVGVCEVPLTDWWLRHCAGQFAFPAKSKNMAVQGRSYE